MMQTVIDGMITQYKTSGNGPVMLFLHGWGDEAKTFDSIVVAFAQDYTCLRLDLPGFGGTDVPEGAWSLTDYGSFVQHFLAKLNLSVDVLVGHSNGGAIAIKALENGQVTAIKLILLSASGIRPKKTFKTTLLTLAAKIGKQLVKILPKANQRAIRKSLYKKLGSDYLAMPHLADTFKKVVREDVRGELPLIKIPVLLVYGEADTDTPLWIAKAFETLLPNATLRIIPLAGHFVHIDALAETIKAMKDFVA